ncbi:MAG: ABC transporter permease subunit [Christensenellales bacterium]
MISKPLFKQSCKANATIWTFVTTITCAMLAIIILVLGNLNVSSIRNSMVDMFIEDSIESTIEKQSMTYFNMTESALVSYEEQKEKNIILKNSADIYKQARVDGADDITARNVVITTLESYTSTTLTNEENVAINSFIDYCLINEQGLLDIDNFNFDSEVKYSNFMLNQIAYSIYNELIETEGQETADNAKQFISQAINDYIVQKQQTGIEATKFASTYIPAILKDIFIEQSFEYQDKTLSISDYYTADEIAEKSSSAITLFNAQSEIKRAQLAEQYQGQENSSILIAQELAEFRLNYIEQTSGGLLEELPENVSNALKELGELNIYSLVIGEIFYRIAGLLLPIIFVIMCSNNLISSQVDSGSMAYVLSTPTKRKTVTLTQIVYLVSSIFVMCCLTTITSVVCLALVQSSEITITYSQILLFNLGSFITLFAISGICFLSSCWFNRSKQAMSVGGGLSMFFLVATILGLFGSKVMPSAIRIEAMNYFNYVSIITLFDTMSIINGTLTFLWKWAILLVIGIATYAVGVIKFNKKDLPL